MSSREPEFAVFPLDWVSHPKCRKLRQADPANPDRWWVLIALATSCRAGGRLVASDGTPLTAEDFAWGHDRQESAWVDFLDLAKSIKLLGIDQSGAFFVIPWANWNREAAKAKSLEDDKFRKRAERAENRVEALELELARVRGDLSESVRICPELSESVRVVRLEEKRREESRNDLNRNDQTDRIEIASRICLSDFSEQNFLKEASSIHLEMKGRRLSGPDRTALKKTVAHWEGAWGDKAAALHVAADCARSRIETGKLDPDGNTWLYALRVAENQIERAAELNATNRAALAISDPDMPVLPLTWDGDP